MIIVLVQGIITRYINFQVFQFYKLGAYPCCLCKGCFRRIIDIDDIGKNRNVIRYGNVCRNRLFCIDILSGFQDPDLWIVFVSQNGEIDTGGLHLVDTVIVGLED